jgi:hypothetical protein
MFNDYEIYNIIEETHIEDDRVIELVKNKYFITNKQWEGILNLDENGR